MKINFSNKHFKVFLLLCLFMAVLYAQVVFFGNTLIPNLFYAKTLIPAATYGREPINSLMTDLVEPSFKDVPLKQFFRNNFSLGSMPLWNSFQGCGAPYAADPSRAVFFPYQILENSLPYYMWDYFVVFRIVLAAFFTYLFLSLFGIDMVLSIAGGLFYALSGSFVWFVFQEPFLNTALMLPLCFLCLERMLLHRSRNKVLQAGLVYGLLFLSGNFSMAFFIFLSSGFYYFLRAAGREEAFLGYATRFLVALSIAFCISAVLILPFLEYFVNAYSCESLSFVNNCSNHSVYELFFSVLIPTFYNFSRQINVASYEYIGDLLGGYTGISVMFLAVFGFIIKGRLKNIFYFFFVLGIAVLLRNLSYPKAFPLFNLFIPAKSSGPVWSFCLIISSVFSLQMIKELKNDDVKRLKKYIWVICRAFLLLLLILFWKVVYVPKFNVFEGFYRRDFYPIGLGGLFVGVFTLISLTLLMSRGGNRRNIFYSIIALSLLELWFYIPKATFIMGSLSRFVPYIFGLCAVLFIVKSKKRYFFVSALFFVLSFLVIELLTPFGFPKRQNILKKPDYVNFLKTENKNYYRIMGCGGVIIPDFASAFELQDVRYAGSFVPLIFKHYVNNYLNENKFLGSRGLWFSGIDEDKGIYKKISDNLAYYSFLGVRYFLTPPDILINLPRIYNKETCIYENPYALSRTYIVQNIKVAENFEYAQRQISNINLLDEAAYIEKEPPAWFKNSKNIQKGFSQIQKYEAGRVEIKVNLKQPGLLVLTDLYYPGWKAYINDKKTKIYRVNGLVRGVFVKHGEHAVIFKYSPLSWKMGAAFFILGIFFFFAPIMKLVRLMEDRLKSRRYLLCGIFIAVLPFIIYANSLSNNFLAGDDEEIIQRNIYLDDWKYLPNFFTENYKQGSGIISNYWRPFQLIVYSIIAHLGGRCAPIFHFSSLFFHSLCGIFLFLILLKLFSKRTSLSLLLLTSAIWLVHPVHNEEMSLISGIASSSHIFWILLGIYAFLLFLENKKKLWYAISLGSCIISLTCKEAAIVFPGLILAVHIVAVKLGLAEKKNVKEYAVLHWPFWMSMFLYVLLRLTVLNFSDTLNFYSEDNIFTQNFMYRIYTCFTVIGHGIWITIFPFSLYPDRSWSIYTSIFTPRVYWSFLAVAGFIFCALKSFRKNPLVSFGIFWFLFSYIPMSNIAAKINSLVWDHWFCLPSIGAFIIVAAFSSILKNKRIIQGLLVFVLIVFSTVTFFRNMCWKDTETRARFILAYQPQTAKEWNNLGMVLAEKGDSEHAIQAYKRSIELSDTYSQTHHNLANIYRNEGLYDKAEEEYLKALKLDKSFYHSYLGLGELYLLKKDKKMAVDFFKKALNIYPHLPNIRAFIEEDE